MQRRNDRRPGPAKRAFRPRSPDERRAERIWLYGIHAVAAALGNPRRTVHRLLATRNAAQRLTEMGITLRPEPEEATPRDLDRLLGPEAVHQGVAAEVAPLPSPELGELRDARLLVVLDQVTDPHNVGAVLRSAAAMGADALVTTARHAPQETGVLAKAASGALDVIPVMTVQNLARTLTELGEAGFRRVGLDSEGDRPIEEALGGERIALVLGAEGKGLRRLTRDICDAVARLDLPGPIRSLNVSNAAAVALYLARRSLDRGSF
jgi:23S rRNA (guanosine2251-2'-O)-methyltransferase